MSPDDDAALSAREIEVLTLLRSGASNAAIGAELYIGLETVKSHLSTIYRKLGVQRRGEAVAWLLDHPEVTGEDDGPLATVAVEALDDGIRFVLVGEFDMSTVHMFVEPLDQALARPPALIEIDMSGVTFIDSGGVRALSRLVTSTDSVTVRVVAPSKAARRVLEFSGLLSVIDVVESS